jgi:hypothetical protein
MGKKLDYENKLKKYESGACRCVRERDHDGQALGHFQESVKNERHARKSLGRATV